MSTAFVVLAAIAVVAILAFFALRPRGRAPATAPAPRNPATRKAPAAATPGGVAPPAEPVPDDSPDTLPPVLAELTEIDRIRLLRADDLPTLRQQALVARLRTIPQPSRVLQQMVSPAFLARASSSELGELVLGEPAVAARVVAAVNSPLYGLQKPVASIGQAVTFLGLTSVRNICLRYLLDTSFQADDPALRSHFDTLWRASAVAGELCQVLAQKLRLPDGGSMATHVVLSFLGQLAIASLLRSQGLSMGVGQDMASRTLSEQEQLGLSASEVGFLLMREWELPTPIIDKVRAIDRMLVTPASELAAPQGPRLALCYLSARLGERLVQGQIARITDFDPATDAGPDFHCLRSHLAQPELARLTEHLHSPEVARLLDRLGATTGMQTA